MQCMFAAGQEWLCDVQMCSNIDHLTETYAMHFYLHYMTNWPELFQVAESADGKLMGYSE